MSLAVHVFWQTPAAEVVEAAAGTGGERCWRVEKDFFAAGFNDP
jgi:hypothetical protein